MQGRRFLVQDELLHKNYQFLQEVFAFSSRPYDHTLIPKVWDYFFFYHFKYGIEWQDRETEVKLDQVVCFVLMNAPCSLNTALKENLRVLVLSSHPPERSDGPFRLPATFDSIVIFWQRTVGKPGDVSLNSLVLFYFCRSSLFPKSSCSHFCLHNSKNSWWIVWLAENSYTLCFLLPIFEFC